MLNQVVLVGRLTKDPEIITTESGKKKTVVNIAVNRPFKNSEGIYETDFIRCVLWNGIAERANEYCKKGDIVCIRGRLQVRSYTNEQGEKKFVTEVIAETIAFVSNYHPKEKDEKN